MTTKTGRLLGAAAALLLATSVLAGCGSDDGPKSSDSGTSSAAEAEADGAEDAAAPESEDGNGRAFDSTDEAVITSVETALSGKNASASWDGSTLRVEVDGSAEDPTAYLYCSTLDALIADDENGVFVYSDGEADCADAPGR